MRAAYWVRVSMHVCGRDFVCACVLCECEIQNWLRIDTDFWSFHCGRKLCRLKFNYTLIKSFVRILFPRHEVYDQVNVRVCGDVNTATVSHFASLKTSAFSRARQVCLRSNINWNQIKGKRKKKKRKKIESNELTPLQSLSNVKFLIQRNCSIRKKTFSTSLKFSLLSINYKEKKFDCCAKVESQRASGCASALLTAIPFGFGVKCVYLKLILSARRGLPLYVDATHTGERSCKHLIASTE